VHGQPSLHARTLVLSASDIEKHVQQCHTALKSGRRAYNLSYASICPESADQYSHHFTVRLPLRATMLSESTRLELNRDGATPGEPLHHVAASVPSSSGVRPTTPRHASDWVLIPCMQSALVACVT